MIFNWSEFMFHHEMHLRATYGPKGEWSWMEFVETDPGMGYFRGRVFPWQGYGSRHAK